MDAFLQTLQRLGPARLALIGFTLLVMIGFFAFIGTRLTAPSYGLLYANLDLKDSAQVVTKLEGMNVPYQVKGDGSTVMVPVDQVARLRLTMAEMGIPHGGSVGYELFDKSDALGETNFQQGINEMRALEGELERTIQSLSAVEAARVHLVLPKHELFTRETQEPSASIVLKTRGATQLSKSQITAVLNLVASAVPGLKTTRISIVDQAGNLLARGNDDSGDGSVTNTSAEEQRSAYETQISRNVEEMLERSLGYGHVRVDVNADMDFDKVTTNQESYDPDGQVVRSTQTTSEINENGGGALEAAAPVTVQTNLPDGQQTQQGGGATSTAPKTQNSRTEETTNYEISKKVTSQIRETGVVRRISVAVLVDGTYTTDPKGERVYQPRSADEIASLTKLVQSAIGYDDKRGDKVEVVNMRFAPPDEAALGPAPIILGLNKQDIFRASESLILAVVAILAILLVIRPLVTRVLETTRGISFGPQGLMIAAPAAQGALPGPASAAIAAAGGILPGAPPGSAVTALIEEPESMIDLGQVEGRVRASSMKKIGEIVDKHPEEAVAIIRSWMYQGA